MKKETVWVVVTPKDLGVLNYEISDYLFISELSVERVAQTINDAEVYYLAKDKKTGLRYEFYKYNNVAVSRSTDMWTNEKFFFTEQEEKDYFHDFCQNIINELESEIEIRERSISVIDCLRFSGC